MTWTAVGTLVQTTTTSLSLSPVTVGDLILIEVLVESTGTLVCSSVSGGNCSWVQVGSAVTGSVNSGWTAAVFAGTATATGSATATLTITGTGTLAFLDCAGQEFHSSVGSWTLDKQGQLDQGSGTNWPTLTPAGSGELYFGYILDGNATAGSTSGFVYQIDGRTNGLGYALSVSSALTPVWGDNGQFFGIAILMQEGAPAAPLPASGFAVYRRHLITGFWGGITVSPPITFVAVPAPVQEYRTPPRRKLARATWRSGQGQGFVAVPAPGQQPRPAPRKRPRRAYVQFIPVRTTNGTVVVVVTSGRPTGDYDGKTWWKKCWILGL